MAAHVAHLADRNHEHTFFLAVSIAMALTVFAGFAPTFYLRPWFPHASQLSGNELILYVHGLAFSFWLILQIAQCALVSAGNVKAHRRPGHCWSGLAAIIVVLGVQSSLVAARREGGFTGVSVPPQEFLAIPLIEMLLFAALVALAVRFRRSPQAHKRLMLLATTLLVSAATLRLPLSPMLRSVDDAVGLNVIFLIALIGWDLLTRRRMHPATAIGGLLVAGHLALASWLGKTRIWSMLAERIT